MKNGFALTIAAVLIICCCHYEVFANTTVLSSYLEKIRTIDEEFLIASPIDSCEVQSLSTPWGYAQLVNFIADNLPIGYAIILEDTVLEFSSHASPFYNLEKTSSEIYYYDFSCYSVITEEEAGQLSAARLPLENNSDTSMNLRFNPSQNHSGVISGFPHYVQLSGDNCIATALSNVLWYWSLNGYSSLSSGCTSFYTMQDSIQNLFNNYFANNAVLSVANSYGSTHGAVSFTGGANWNPLITTVYLEILAGYPCLVGFAAGSVYSPLVGHMTACYGFNYVGSTQSFYMLLADGHYSYQVSRLWTSYNDCVIKLRIQ